MDSIFQTALVGWLNRAQKIVDDGYNGYFLKPVLHIDQRGRKFIRIVKRDQTQHSSVFCFIEKSTGDVLKAASWHAPALHARGNIYQVGKEGVDAYGALYLK